MIEKQGIDPNSLDKNGNTPLFYCCQKDAVNIVEYLIQKIEIDPKVKNKSNSTLIHFCSQNGAIHILDYFIDKLKKDEKDIFGKTAFGKEFWSVLALRHCPQSHLWAPVGLALHYGGLL